MKRSRRNMPGSLTCPKDPQPRKCSLGTRRSCCPRCPVGSHKLKGGKKEKMDERLFEERLWISTPKRKLF